MARFHFRLRWSFLSCVIFAAVFSPEADAAEPADFRSQHFLLHTDIGGEKAKKLLEEMERTILYVARHWKRAPRGIVECFVVADVGSWPEGELDATGVKAIGWGGGITLTRTFRSGRNVRATARVYASAKGTSAKHEAVHAYCRQAFGEVGPLWYAEGMAELGQFYDGSEGVDCDAGIATYLRTTTPRTLDQILDMKVRNGQEYGWAWSLCHLMFHNPNYAERFQRFGAGLLQGKKGGFRKMFKKELEQIAFEHRLLLSNLRRGYRVDLCAWDWKTEFGRPLLGKTRELAVAANRGWQATGLELNKGQPVRYRAEGTWRIEPVGAELSAAGGNDGRGRLMGVLMNEFQLGQPFPLGKQGLFTPRQSGRLFVRCQDDWHKLADNQGGLTLTLPEVAAASASPPGETKTPTPKVPGDAAAAERKAAGKLRLARLLLDSSPAAAKKRLREVVEKFPGTKAAKEAQRLLQILGG